MGLFSNNKKLCPVCGKPTPRLLATKVEDMPICKDCDRKIDLPKGLVDKMTLDKFSKYISYHDQQQPLRDKFTETYRFDFGFGKGTFVMDASHGFFKLKDDENALIMEISNFKSLRVLEDDKPLYESQGGTIKCYKSMMPSKIRAMSTQITQYEAQRREYEMVEQMERMRDERDRLYDERDRRLGGRRLDERDRRMDDRRFDERSTRTYRSEPTFDGKGPFRYFYVELAMKHPYWGSIRWPLAAPEFDRYYPSVNTYLQEYEDKVDQLHTLVVNLIQMVSPGAKEIQMSAAGSAGAAAAQPVKSVLGNKKPAAAAGTSAVEEIKKYKELLDAGVITQEEFSAKKKQLMGI